MWSGRPKKFFIWTSGLWIWSSTILATPLKVVIDPGHGGKDHGAVLEEHKESIITLQVSEKLAERLKSDSRFQTALTRTTDEFLSLSQRVERADQAAGDLFLSIHVNWSADPRAHGLEVYFQNQLPPDEESMFLANRENQHEGSHKLVERMPAVVSKLKPEVQLIVQDLFRNQRILASSQLAKTLKHEWRGLGKSKSLSIRQAPFFVISNLNIPSVLVEIGFLSNANEGPQLIQDNYQAAIAQSLHQGLIQYQQSLDKSTAPRLQ